MIDTRFEEERESVYSPLNELFRNPPSDKSEWAKHLDELTLRFVGAYVHEARLSLERFHTMQLEDFEDPQYSSLLAGKENPMLPSAVIAYIPDVANRQNAEAFCKAEQGTDSELRPNVNVIFDDYIGTKPIQAANWDERFASMKHHNADGAIVWDCKDISTGYVLLKPTPEAIVKRADQIAKHHPKTVRAATRPFIPEDLQVTNETGHQGGKISAGAETSLAREGSDIIIMRQTAKRYSVGTVLRCRDGISDVFFVEKPRYGQAAPEQYLDRERELVIVHAHYKFSPELKKLGEPTYEYLTPSDLGLIVE